MLALGAGGTGIAFLIFYTLIADIGPSRATLVTYIAPGFAVLYGIWLLSEPLTAGGVLGLVLILAGSWIAVEGRLPGQPKVVREPPRGSRARVGGRARACARPAHRRCWPTMNTTSARSPVHLRACLPGPRRTGRRGRPRPRPLLGLPLHDRRLAGRARRRRAAPSTGSTTSATSSACTTTPARTTTATFATPGARASAPWTIPARGRRTSSGSPTCA